MVIVKHHLHYPCEWMESIWEGSEHQQKFITFKIQLSCFLSFCFSLLIMIMMCQLSKCLFCVWVQRTNEVCDDRKSIHKQQQRLCQICNRNRWGNNWITSETGGLQCIFPVLHIVQAYKPVQIYRCLVQSQCVSLCSAFAWSSEKYLVTCLIVFDVFLCCFKRTNKY